MESKVQENGGGFIRSDGWVVSPDGMKRLKEGGNKGHLLAEKQIEEQIGKRYRVLRPLDRDAAAILSSVKGLIPRAVFLSNAIMREMERGKEVE